MNDIHWQPSAGELVRWLALIGFSIFFLSIGESGAFLSDNHYIYTATENLDWIWQIRFDALWEWLLFAVTIIGLYLFMFHSLQLILCKMTIQTLLLITTSIAITTAIVSIDFNNHLRQEQVSRDFENMGGHITLAYHAIIFTGNWYQRILTVVGTGCSIHGFLATSAKLFAGPKNAG